MQALFSKLQQLAIIAGDVLLGKEKLQKILLARLTETVIIWLSNEQEFWSAFEDESNPLQPYGLQQVVTHSFSPLCTLAILRCQAQRSKIEPLEWETMKII